MSAQLFRVGDGEVAALLARMPVPTYLPLAFGPGWLALDLDLAEPTDKAVGEALLAVRQARVSEDA